MYNTILFATDLLNEHNQLAQQAASIAKQNNAILHLIHVIELPASVQLAQGLGFTELARPVKDDAQAVLALLGEQLNVSTNCQYVEIGSVKEHILNKIKELKCQLVIIGNHTSLATSLHTLLGSTAHAIISHAPCDVLTLRV